MISVIILTKNEEKDLGACLRSANWSDDIHVLDSGSTDKTLDIAISNGAKVSINEFKSFGQQRNFALDHLQINNEWIFFLDADEIDLRVVIDSDAEICLNRAHGETGSPARNLVDIAVGVSGIDFVNTVPRNNDLQIARDR